MWSSVVSVRASSDRRVPRRDEHARAEADPLGGGRGERQGDDRVEHDALLGAAARRPARPGTACVGRAGRARGPSPTARRSRARRPPWRPRRWRAGSANGPICGEGEADAGGGASWWDPFVSLVVVGRAVVSSGRRGRRPAAHSSGGRADSAAARKTAKTSGGAIDMPPTMSPRSSTFMAGSMNTIDAAITAGGIDARSAMSSASSSSVGTAARSAGITRSPPPAGGRGRRW